MGCGAWTGGILATSAVLLTACGREEAGPGATSPRRGPNVLFVVWDTTRADHLSALGYPRPTTPFLERWSQRARVFEDCVSTASSTVPSHGAMFTGLLPCEHGANNGYNYLDDQWVTLAELFKAGGYRTYCFAANPHIDSPENFVQGFDVHEHPYDDAHRARALEVVQAKLDPRDESSELTDKLDAQRRPRPWALKAAGEVAEEALNAWLDASDSGKPFFAFLNYMEAHRQFIPPARYRERFMTPEQVEASYKADRSWDTMWAYTLGMYEYTPEELEVMALTYDACLYELDRLFESLMTALEARGALENTIVVLTADHGEHLGEHHMLDHQFSLYQGLVHVPLFLSGPGIEPGRVTLPVQNYDLFPTLLELAHLQPPPGLVSRAVSLLRPDPERVRLSEYPSAFTKVLDAVEDSYPETFERALFERSLRALLAGDLKLIAGGDGRSELYDLARDPDERADLGSDAHERREALQARLDGIFAQVHCFDPETDASPSVPASDGSARDLREHARMLQDLGYAGEEQPAPRARRAQGSRRGAGATGGRPGSPDSRH